MKKFFNIFFTTLGVIFLVIILFVVYLFIADPYNIKPLIYGTSSDTESSVSSPSETDNTQEPVVDKNTTLSEDQEKALDTLGINPSEITPEQQECFINLFGEARVQEIISGDSPSATEMFKARVCI